jgi:hypothetical protein
MTGLSTIFYPNIIIFTSQGNRGIETLQIEDKIKDTT